MKMKFIALLSTFWFVGCVSTIPISTYPTEDIGTTGSNLDDDGVFRVIVTEIKSRHGSKTVTGLSETAEAQIEAIIQESGAKRVNVDRKVRDKLELEFKLIEAQGVSEYTPPQAANLAISGEITSAIITPVFVAEPQIFNAETKKMVAGPPECRYTAKIHGTLEFYTVNPVNTVKRITLNGIEKFKQPAHNCKDLPTGQSQNMFKAALHQAMESAADDIKNQMASTGYVRALRKDPKTNTFYYRISIKPVTGAVAGVDINFMKAQVIDGHNELFPFAKGVIACTNMPKYAFVKLLTEGAESKIIAGTPVKLSFSTSIIGRIIKEAQENGIPISSIPGLSCKP